MSRWPGSRLGIRSRWARPRSSTRVITLVAFFSSMYFYLPAITPFLQFRGLSFAQISMFQAILLGTGLLFDLPTGALADRFGRRHILSAALAFQVVSESIFLFAHDFWVFALGQVIGGIGSAMASGCVTAIIYESLPERDRPAAMQRVSGTIGAAVQLAGIIAYFGGGLLVADLKLGHILLAIQLTILCLLIALGGSFLIPERKAPHDPLLRRLGLRRLIQDGFGVVRHNRRLQRITLVYLLTTAFPLYLQVLYQPYLIHAGAGGGWLGPALGIGSLLALLGQHYAHALERWLGVRLAVLFSTALPGVLYLLMSVCSQSIISVALFCVLWGAIPLREPLFAGYANTHIPSESRATVLSLVNTMRSVYSALVGVGIGLIAESSLSLDFALMGALVLGGALVLRIDEKDLSTEVSTSPL
jgi:MFS family permease